MSLVTRSAALLAILGVLCTACARFGASDPRAAGDRHDRWDVVVARPRWVVFDLAREVLADSGYVLAQTNLDLGILSTADRQARRQPLGTMPVDYYPVRLRLTMTPLGRDSTRLSITGQYRPGNSAESSTVTVRHNEWRLVQGIGEAILMRLR